MLEEIELAVITAQIGSYDPLSPFEYESEKVNAFCVTDRPELTAKGWNYLQVPFHSPNPKRASLFVKTHPFEILPVFPKYVLWMDGRISTTVDPLTLVEDLVNQERKSDLWAFKHPERRYLSEELSEVDRLELSPRTDLARTLRLMRDTGQTRVQPYETGVLLISNTAKTRNTLSRWWTLIEDGSARDQLTFPIAIHLEGAALSPIKPMTGATAPRGVRDDMRFHVGSHTKGKEGRKESVSYTGEEWKSRCTIGYRYGNSGKIAVPKQNDFVSDRTRTPIDIIIPIHNAPVETSRCVASVLNSMCEGDQVLLVDDGSEQETGDICNQFERSFSDRVRVIRHPKGSGFTKAANRGLRSVSLDKNVLLLNSDTVLTRNALSEIRSAVDQDQNVGAASPLSNRAMVQSIFDHEDLEATELLELYWGIESGNSDSVADLTDFLLEVSRVLPSFFYAPSLNGFCILMSARAIRSVGLLDEVHFPRGYGEETDWSFRVADAGFTLKVVTSAFVYHQKKASYGAEDMAELKRDAASFLRSTYGLSRYGRGAVSVRDHPVMCALRDYFSGPIGSARSLGASLEVLDDPVKSWLNFRECI